MKWLSDERESPARYYITVGAASFRVRARDCHRAADNAKIIRMPVGTKAYAVVVGQELSHEIDSVMEKKVHTDVREFIEAGDPEGVSSYRLESE